MIQRPLGRSGLSIAPLMLGGNVFGWTADRAASFEILDRFVDAGLDAIDTADIYSAWVPGHSGGESESTIGAWLHARGMRDRVRIATKVGGAMGPPGGPWQRSLRADYIVSSLEGSLKRLRTDYIDLYQAHADDPETPLEETLEAFERLIKAGKVRVAGASHFAPGRLAEALEISGAGGLPRFETLQPRYSLCARDEFEGEVQAQCLRKGIGVLCYGVLAKGFLTGKFRSEGDVAGKVYADFLRPHLGARGQQILKILEAIADGHATTCAAVAIAWVLAQPGVAAAIAAVETPGQLQDLLGAVELNLAPSEIAALNDAGGHAGDVPGA